MENIRIMRLKCPSDHIIAGLAYHPAEHSREEVIVALKSGMKAAKVNPWCAVCKSRELIYDSHETDFSSMNAAMPFIIAEAAKQAELRREFSANVRRQARLN